uniref:uncharacterized protein LOC101301684 isoform X2 n=1 Tax=Fragaria vesca subsp. vesca TaxID=101020 RepID=UPI0005CAB29C|nr:PREDICTED: uncharacterized protein LOC101301684 isoform X2 [Fragaria vesca subsp. vesca]
MERRFYYQSSFALQWNPIGTYIKGSNALLKYVFFRLTRPFRRLFDPRSANMIHIHLQRFDRSATRLSIHSPIKLVGKPNFVSERRFMVPISDAIARRDVYSEIIAGYVFTLGFPDYVCGQVIRQIYQVMYDVIEVGDDYGLPITVIITEVAVKVLGKSVAPPTKSTYRLLLNRVRPDSLESTVTQESCFGCRERLDHVYDAEEGITRLPACLHVLHVDCLVQLLQVNRKLVCPICSHPLPFLGYLQFLDDVRYQLVVHTLNPGFLISYKCRCCQQQLELFL